MNYKINFLLGVLLVCCVLGTVSAQVCGECMENGVKCLNTYNFQSCNGDSKHEELYICGTGKVCTNSTSVCKSEPLDPGVVKPCVELPPTPTEQPDPLAQKCRDAAEENGGVKLNMIPDVDDCRGYLYCVWSGNDVEGILFKCPKNTHFDNSKKKCVVGDC